MKNPRKTGPIIYIKNQDVQTNNGNQIKNRTEQNYQEKETEPEKLVLIFYESAANLESSLYPLSQWPPPANHKNVTFWKSWLRKMSFSTE
jgi:hypothetical protein